MAINGEHASIILKRVFDSQDPFEQIELVSGKDKRRVPIHRVILNAASKYFTGMLGPNFQEGKPTEFRLDDSDGGTIKSVVDFCYTGNIDLIVENVENILEIASRVEIDLLEDKCRQFYSARLSVANAVSIWMTADKYRFGDLRERALNLICDEFNAVPVRDCQKLSHRLIRELLKCDKIHEFGDLGAVRLLEWFQWDEDERSVHMPEILKLIRLEQLTLKFLSDTFEAVCKKFKCSDLVHVEYKRRALKFGGSELVSAECKKSSKDQRIDDSLSHSRSTFCVISGYGNFGLNIEKYNDTTNCFDEMLKIPIGQRRCYSVVLQKNKIFVLGGQKHGRSLNSVSSYDLSTGKKVRLPGMSVARQLFTSISVGKYIYVFGGYGESGHLNSCERFDTENNAWETIKSMKVERCLASAAVLNGYIYVVGGYTTAGIVTSIEIYDPKTDEWTEAAEMNIPRDAFSLLESNGFLYAMGFDKVIERFDPFKNAWTVIGSFDDSDQIRSAINTDGTLVAVMSNGTFGRVEIDGGGKFSFVSLSESNYQNLGERFLFHV